MSHQTKVFHHVSSPARHSHARLDRWCASDIMPRLINLLFCRGGRGMLCANGDGWNDGNGKDYLFWRLRARRSAQLPCAASMARCAQSQGSPIPSIA